MNLLTTFGIPGKETRPGSPGATIVSERISDVREIAIHVSDPLVGPKAGSWFVMGKFSAPHPNDETMVFSSALVLDLDNKDGERNVTE